MHSLNYHMIVTYAPELKHCHCVRMTVQGPGFLSVAQPHCWQVDFVSRGIPPTQLCLKYCRCCEILRVDFPPQTQMVSLVFQIMYMMPNIPRVIWVGTDLTVQLLDSAWLQSAGLQSQGKRWILKWDYAYLRFQSSRRAKCKSARSDGTVSPLPLSCLIIVLTDNFERKRAW